MKNLRRIENYQGLVTKKAIQYWRSLPAPVKAYVSMEDLINDGMIFARFEVMLKYDPKKYKTKFSTLLFLALDRFYQLRIIELVRIKRSLPGEQVRIGDIDEAHEDAVAIDPPDNNQIDLMLAVSGERGIKKVYVLASPRLRRYIECWFFSSKGITKVFKRSGPFIKASKEFRRIASITGLDKAQCAAFLDRRKKEDYNVDILSSD